MSRQARSSRLPRIFGSALQDYEKTTKITLDNHPIADQLRYCHSVEATTKFIQNQAREFGHFRGSDRIMKSITNTVSVLCMLAATAGLSDAVYLVCLEAQMGVFYV
jgi:hypothetical protein